MKTYKAVLLMSVVIGSSMALSACGGHGGKGVSTAPGTTPPPPAAITQKVTVLKVASKVVSVQENVAGETVLFAATANDYMGNTASGKLIFGDAPPYTHGDGTLIGMNRDGTGKITLVTPAANTATVTTSVLYCGVTPGNRVIYTVVTDTVPPLPAGIYLSGQVYSVAADGSSSAPVALSNAADVEYCDFVHPNGRVLVSKLLANGATWSYGKTGLYSHDGAVAGTTDSLYIYPDATGDTNVWFSYNKSTYWENALASDGRMAIVYYADRSAVAFSPLTTAFSVYPDGTGFVVLDSNHYNAFVSITKTGKAVIDYDLTAYVPWGPFPVSHMDISNMDGTGKVALISGTESGYYDGSTASGKILFDLSSVPGGIYSSNEDGTGRVMLSTTNSLELYDGPYVSGSRVVFTQGTSITALDMVSVNENGTGRVMLTTGSSNYGDLIGISNSGRVVYTTRPSATNRDIYSVNLDGTGLVSLASTADNEAPFSLWYGNSALTTNNKLIYSHESSVNGVGGIHSTNVDGTGDIYLTPVLSPAVATYSGAYYK